MESRQPKVKTKVIQTKALVAKRAEMRKRMGGKPNRRIKSKGKPRGAGIAPLEMKIVQPGEVRNPDGAPPGKRLLTRVREMLRERSIQLVPVMGPGGLPQRNPDGTVIMVRSENTRFDDVADAFVRQMEQGNFNHTKEFIEREEGKMSQSLVINDPSQMKLYENVPIDGPDAP